MQLIILASGRGSRLEELTNQIPKCLVNINNKPIIGYQKKIFKYFSSIIIVVGYKKNLIKKYFKDFKNIIFIENKIYTKSNMVYSLSLTKNIIKEDCIVTYSDIIFDTALIRNLIKKTDNILPINKNWKKLWLLRMSKKKLFLDAENLVLTNNYITEIGTPIIKELPKYQFMGIIKFDKKSILKFIKFFLSLSNINISFTEFMNFIVLKKYIKFKALRTSVRWYEIDNKKDLIIVEKLIKNHHF